jgi:hypothetical protein
MMQAYCRRFPAARAALLLGLGFLVPACSSEKPAPPPAPATNASPAPASAELWGDLKAMVSVKELMHDMIDPIADNIFDAVSTVTTPKGTVEKLPKTDDDWDKLRIGAVTMVEGANLLRIARPFAPADAKDDSAGPDATELSTAEITAKRQRDPVEWNARVEALRNVGLQVLDIIKKKDTKELWDASDNLDTACENCHKSFWYPKEDDEFYRKLNVRLKDFVEKSKDVPKPDIKRR